MKHIIKIYFPLIFLFLLVFISCREPLVSSADERKEELIQGQWVLQSSVPEREGSITLVFESGTTRNVVHIIVSGPAGTGEFDFYFRIEDGDLYFLALNDNNQEIEFLYNIVELTQFNLVLSFAESSGQNVTQTYVRP